jgi:hypothetical protein
MRTKIFPPGRLAATVALAAAMAAGPDAGLGEARKPIKIQGLTQQQIAQIPDDQPVEFLGKVTTKRELNGKRAQMETLVKVKLQQLDAASKNELERLRGTVRAHQRSRIEKGNAAARNALQRQKMAGGGAGSEKAPGTGPQKRVTPGSGTPLGGLSGDLGEFCVKPTLKTMFGVPAPGAALAILGCGFGSQPGQVKLKGQFPGGELLLTGLEWSNGGIGGTVPAISAVPDQPIKIQVQTSKGELSNEFSSQFDATDDVQVIPAEAVTTTCSDESDDDDCDPVSGRTLDASHWTGLDYSNDDGVDKVKGSLKNGWVLDHWSMKESWQGLNGAHANDPQGFSNGATSFNVSVSWSVAPGTHLGYWLKLYATGPEGIAFK